MPSKEDYEQIVNAGQWLGFEQLYGTDTGGLDYEAVAERYDDVTAKLVEDHYLDYKKSPKGDQNKGVRATKGSAPNKANLIQKANDCYTWLAFSEIIDNILDNYRIFVKEMIRENIQPHDLEVNINISNTDKDYDYENEGQQPDACRIMITENSGGILMESVDGFLSLGTSSWDVENAVGVWGNGQKVAMCRLGRYNRVSSRHRNDEEGGLFFQLGDSKKESVDSEGHNDGGYYVNKETEPRNYYSDLNSEWEVQVYSIPEEDQQELLNQTITAMTKVPELTRLDLDDTDPEGYVSKYIFQRLSKIFANKVRENKLKFQELIGETTNELNVPNMQVWFNHSGKSEKFDILNHETADLGENDESAGDFEKLRKQFCYIPGSLLPSTGDITIPQAKIPNARDDLHISWLIGTVNLNNPPERKGFMCWGNGKLFEPELKEIVKLPGAFTKWDNTRPEQCHWKGYLKFWSKDPSLIPWGAPTKWGWNEENKVREILNDLLSAIATPYWTHSSRLGTEKVQELEEYFGYWEDGDN